LPVSYHEGTENNRCDGVLSICVLRDIIHALPSEHIAIAVTAYRKDAWSLWVAEA